MEPIQNLSPETAKNLRYVLHDIDDTITNEGKLLPEAYAAMCPRFLRGKRQAEGIYPSVHPDRRRFR